MERPDALEREMAARYATVGRRDGNELRLRHADALRFVDDAERLGAVILGMDFYYDRGDYTVETLGPADYSELADHPDAVRASAAAARALLRPGLPDDTDWVSFVITPATPEQVQRVARADQKATSA